MVEMLDNEIELSEEQLQKLARSLKEERKSHTNKLNQKENVNFAKLNEMPIVKKKGLIPFLGKGKLVYAKRTNHKEEMYKELEKPNPDLKLIKDCAEKIKKGEIEEYRPIKTPYLEMIRSDGSKEWFEGVKAGTLEITRSDEKTAYIDLRKDKLLVDTIRNYDDSMVQGWVVYENDQNPLPANTYMDSHAYFSNLEEIMANKKDVQTERLKAWGNIGWTIGFIFIAILVVAFVVMPWFTGQNLLQMLDNAGDDDADGATNVKLTPEEMAIINQLRDQKAQNNSMNNGGGS